MKRFRSKRGMTLVELIASMMISVIIVGAACASMFFGFRSSRDGTAGVVNHGNAKLVETYFQNVLPTSTEASVSNQKLSQKDCTSGVWNFYFDGSKDFVVEQGGEKQLTVEGIDSVDITIGSAGNRTRLDYVIHSRNSGNDFALYGGVVLNNSDGANGTTTKTLSSSEPEQAYLNVEI